MVECVDPERIDEVLDVLRAKYGEIVRLVGEGWIESVTFNVRVCSNIPEHYWVIKLDIGKGGADG